MAEILVVDDDQSLASALEEFLRLEGHACTVASNAIDAVRGVDAQPPDLVLMDIRMPGVDGLAALRELRERHRTLPVIIMTAHGTSQTSIDAIKAGALEYLTKPFDLEQVRAVIDRALEARAAAAPVAGPADEVDPLPSVTLVGDAPEMVELYKMIGTLAGNDVPTLIVGERGTGKELVATTIHRNSARRDQPFVSLDCATASPEMVESEIGGSRTGTVYLADVQALPGSTQTRLARLLAARPTRVSSAPTGMRIIASTERETTGAADGRVFHHELHDALAVITLRLPSLRSRRADIPVLVRHLVQRFNQELGKEIHGVDESVLKRFQEYAWPGNVQELATVIKRAAIVTRRPVIGVDEIGPMSKGGPVSEDRGEVESALARAASLALQERLVQKPSDATSSIFHDIVGFVESALVKEALSITNNNQVKASELLGVNRATLRKKALG